ncbi:MULTISPECIES: hypothetical protein [Bacillus]|nr:MULTISPECIES: hypothetical protein [Bacillus cereus group]EDZ49003.1 hypothetical protein BCAH1134_C0238 [Bacillus cereus AH1134]MCC2384549.1 hypothetical protein [Bacillus cereus]NKX61531.1 hypothetical protein [Bacillus cereus]HDR8340607.1 hypothetical protein [Bacillus cereus]HDR8351616.1 hypothetical protein [Bacillus cereus]
MTAAVICILTDNPENDIFEWVDFLEVGYKRNSQHCMYIISKKDNSSMN